MADLSDVQPGDTVFVVQQRRRHQQTPRACDTDVVTKVGRKYAYIGTGHREKPFSRETGHSHHVSDGNARANGCGFDVYHSREEYEREQHEQAEYERLKERLVHRWRGLVELSPKVVQGIHRVLDGEIGDANAV